MNNIKVICRNSIGITNLNKLTIFTKTLFHKAITAFLVLIILITTVKIS